MHIGKSSIAGLQHIVMTSSLPEASRQPIELALEELQRWKVEVIRLTEAYAQARVAADGNPGDKVAAESSRAAWDALLRAIMHRDRSQAILKELEKLAAPYR